MACKILLSILLVGSIGLLYGQEPAKVHPYLTERSFIDIGVFFPDRRLKLSADGSISGIQPFVDFNKDLRLKASDETFAVDFGWRFTNNWLLFGQYFESNGHSLWTLEEDIEWKDVVF